VLGPTDADSLKDTVKKAISHYHTDKNSKPEALTAAATPEEKAARTQSLKKYCMFMEICKLLGDKYSILKGV
jgi:hypothetical protein